MGQKFDIDLIVLQFDLYVHIVLQIESKANSLLCLDMILYLLYPYWQLCNYLLICCCLLLGLQF